MITDTCCSVGTWLDNTRNGKGLRKDITTGYFFLDGVEIMPCCHCLSSGSCHREVSYGIYHDARAKEVHIANAVCEDGEARVHECRKIIKIRVVEYVN